MAQTVFFIELLSFAIVAFLLYGCLFETKQKSKKKRAFITLLSLSMISIGADAVTWLLEEGTNRPVLYAAALIVAFTATSASHVALTWYLGIHVSEKHGVPFGIFKVIMGIGMTATATIAVGCFAGWFYRVEDGVYQATDAYAFCYYFQIVFLLVLLAITLIFAKRIGVHDTIAVCVYLVLPTVVGILGMASLGYELAYGAMGLDMLFIYITLQSENESGLIRQNELTHQLAHVDELTGLQNRLSFFEFIERLPADAPVGIIFCDVNGLKTENDNNGHRAGDALLFRFSECLISSFRKEYIFRISGDEFVVCLPKTEEEEVNDQVAELRGELDAMERPIASIGSAFGTGRDIQALLSIAEMDMYRSKQAYYENYPEFKRS